MDSPTEVTANQEDINKHGDRTEKKSGPYQNLPCKTIKNKKIATVVLHLLFLQNLDFALDELYFLLKSKTVTY